MATGGNGCSSIIVSYLDPWIFVYGGATCFDPFCPIVGHQSFMLGADTGFWKGEVRLTVNYYNVLHSRACFSPLYEVWES